MRRVDSNASEYTGAKGFRRVDYVKITIFGFALSALWSSLHGIILPVRLLDFVAESQKNTYLGLLTFTGLLLAMAVQPIAGAISDRSGFSWGRRRPYILVGAILAILFISGMGFAGSYIAIFVIYCLLQVSSNTAQGPWQGFIPDMVPGEKRGLASGVKGLFELLGSIVVLRLIIAPFMNRYFTGEGSSWLWLALGALAVVMLGVMIATVLTVKERPGVGGAQLPSLSTLYKSFKIDVKAQPNFIPFLVSRLLFLMPLVIITTFGLYFLQDFVGVANPVTATADLIVAAGASMLVVVYPAGRLSDKIGRRPVAIVAAFIGALGIVLLYFFPSYGYIMLAGSFLGISYGAFTSANWALATDLVTRGEEARYLGLVNLATAGASALARLIGPVIDFFNAYSAGLGYSVMLLACFTFFIASAMLLLRIKAR